MTPAAAALPAPDRRLRVDELFERALELPEAARGDFLDRAGGGEPGLRAEVDELLQLTADRSPALEPGSLAMGPLWGALAGELAPRTADEGRRLGPWRVVRELGKGGMGSVYLVERADGHFTQQAALKLVLAGTGSEELLRRFEQERQILASLNHANIARLLDGGRAADGRPYFAMEYVEGRPIDRYCDEERLSVEQRLDLFVEVGRAVEHAHRNLIVHRDVKPSNITVTAEGEVKLLDFGIAKLLSLQQPTDGSLTRVQGRVFTPEYASPEQVRGEPVTTASDVYQLGLLLYELLAGVRAQRIDDTSPTAFERAVCQTPPIRPSVQMASAPAAIPAARRASRPALVRRLRGDLDSIVLCALRKDPERRYGSVGELLDDVVRHRRGLPIRARPDTLGYRLRKFAGRRRVGLVWTLLAILAAAGILTALGVQRLRTAREARRAEQIEGLLAELFKLPAPSSPSHPPTAREYADHAAELVRSELGDQPASQARLLTLLGQVYGTMGSYDAAIDVLAPAVDLSHTRLGEDSNELASALDQLALNQHYLGRYEQAEDSLRQVLALRERRFGPGDPITLHTRLELGDLQHTRGRLVAAEGTLRGAVTLLRDMPAEREALAQGLRDLGNVLRDRGAVDESAASYRESIALFRELDGDPDPQAASAEVYFARLRIMTGELSEAESLLTAALRELGLTYGDDHPLTATALRNLGYLRLEQGRFAEAEELLAQAMEVYRGLGPEHPMIARDRTRQAELAQRRGRPGEAVELAEAALALFTRLDLGEHPSAFDARRTLGDSLLELGRPRRAAAELATALAVAERQFVAGDRRIALTREALARARRAAASEAGRSPG